MTAASLSDAPDSESMTSNQGDRSGVKMHERSYAEPEMLQNRSPLPPSAEQDPESLKQGPSSALPKTNERVRKRHGARNQHKIKSFTRWLTESFPDFFRKHPSNASAPLIVDIAGGKGELAARLVMCCGMRVVLIDPRPAKVASCFTGSVLPRLPKKWKERITERLEMEPDFVADQFKPPRFRQICEPLTDENVRGGDCGIPSVLQEGSLFIGMHADGATEAIVEAALFYGKPFVVVPCCVFPNLFTQRKLRKRDGIEVPVRTTEQFCDYLLQKDKRFRKTVLPFEGRNIAIWWDGKEDLGSS